MSLELHEPVSRSDRAHTIDDIFRQSRKLPKQDQYLEQMTFLNDARRILHATTRAYAIINAKRASNDVTTTVNESAATHEPDVIDREHLMALRTSLTLWIDDSAELMGGSESIDSAWIVGWSRMSLTWTVIAYASVLLDELDEYTRRQRRAGARFRPADSQYLRAQEIVLNAALYVDEYSTSELVDAVYVVRRRLERLESMSSDLMLYVQALEHRCAHLIVGAFNRDAGVHDDMRWRADDLELFKANRSFVTASAWWFVCIRRYLRDYLETLRPQFYSFVGARETWPSRTTLRAHRIACPVAALRVGDETIVTRVFRFMADRAKMYSSPQHTKTFRSKAAPYAVTPGDLEACTYIRTDGEPVSWRDAIGTTTSGPAADFVARAKFHVNNRRLGDWLDLLWHRRHVNNARPCGGLDGLFEELAFLHTVRVFMHDQYKVPFGEWFIVMHRNATKHVREYQRRIVEKLALPNRRPFIVQRLGRFGVVVPRNDDIAVAVVVNSPERDSSPTISLTSLERRVFITLGIDLEHRLVFSDQQQAQMYEFVSVLDAFTAWVAFMSIGWDGVMHSTATCSRLLSILLTGRTSTIIGRHYDHMDDADATSVSATTSHNYPGAEQHMTSSRAPPTFIAGENIGRARPVPSGTILADM